MLFQNYNNTIHSRLVRQLAAPTSECEVRLEFLSTEIQEIQLEAFDFIINTPFENNYRAYNIYFLINYVVYISYFNRLLNNKGLVLLS